MQLNSVKGTELSTIAGLLLACSLFFSACAPEEDSLIIGIVGDQFGAYDTDEALNIMQKGVTMLEDHRP
ncbi:TPA: hypothetical protein DCG86_03875, partial [Candidatus Marinimicrobia bacterium]|nr:hypothetical protein [Candidatus Neomarinimicrobiota bacterium]